MILKILSKSEYLKYLSSMINLYNITFNSKVNEEYFSWRYLDNPFSQDLLMAVAIENEEVVSSYSASPYILKNGDEFVKSAMIIHTMTHPNHKGKGLFVSLGKLLYDFLQKKGYEFIWGFPNELIHSARISKLDWKDIFEFPTMTLDVNDFNPIKSDFENDETFDLENKYPTQNKICIYKNNDYFHWRYKNHPINNYICFKIERNIKNPSFVILKKYSNKINIVDYSFDNLSDFELLINHTVNYSIKVGCNLITTWANMNSIEKIYFERNNFKNNLPITYFSGRLLNMEMDDNILNINNWSVFMGDDNVY